MMFRTCTILLFVFLSLISVAKQNKLSDKVTGIWFSPPETEFTAFAWKAAWIWADESLETDAVLTRRKIQIDTLPTQALLRITASSVYQLYINGDYICNGPARCAPHHQSYDILDVTKMFKTGKNVIAVRVHHQRDKKSYLYDERSGLLIQLELQTNAVKSTVLSDKTWKVLPDPSWDNNAPVISRFQQVVNDRVDFRAYPAGWEKPDFDDRDWKAANELMRKTGWPAPQINAKAQPLTPPWTTLVPRDIPYLAEKNIDAKKLIEAVEIRAPIVGKPHFITGVIKLKGNTDSTLEIPACEDSSSWLLIYDFERIINGMPRLDIQGNAGTKVEIISAPYILDNTFTHLTVDSDFRDIIFLSGNRDKWEATYFKPVRYLGIMIRNNAPVKLFSAGIHQIAYPFEKRGEMRAEDAPWINHYFEATAKTINVCTTDAFTDNYRERRQYAQTGYYGAMGNYWIFGDYALQRRYLIQIAREQYADGIMPAYAPPASGDYMIILDSNCLWIRSLKNYLLFSGDEKTVRELLPAAEKLMALLHGFTNSSGLIDNPPWAYWLDHALIDRRGANFTLNGHYLGALEDFAAILQWLQLPDDEIYNDRAAKIRLALQRCWDNDKQLFADALIDGKPSEMFSEHAQAMALAMKLATPDQAQKIAGQLLEKDNHNYIKRASGMIMVTPAMSYFLHKGLCNYGYVNESFELFKNRFGKMLDPRYNGTLWEEWWLDGTGRTGRFQGGRSRSDAQTESAFAPALIAEFIAGIIPVKPGMKEVVIQRTGFAVKNLDCAIPAPQGELNVSWKAGQVSHKLMLEIPKGMQVLLDVTSFQNLAGHNVIVKDIRLNIEFLAKTDVKLDDGNYTIEF